MTGFDLIYLTAGNYEAELVPLMEGGIPCNSTRIVILGVNPKPIVDSFTFNEIVPYKFGNFNKPNEPYYRQYEKKGGKKW